MKLTRKIKKVQEELSAKVQQEYRHEIRISVREEPGPFGLKIIVACNPQAHPGTGMKRVLMDAEGTTYGIHGEKTLAELFHQNDWIRTPPEPKSFLKLVNQACFEGIGKFSEEESKFVKKGNNLEFYFVRIEHPSGKKIKMVSEF